MTIEEFKVQRALGSLSWDMRKKLAKDSNTPIEILAELPKGESCMGKEYSIKYWLATNSSTPIKILKKLSGHPMECIERQARLTLSQLYCT